MTAGSGPLQGAEAKLIARNPNLHPANFARGSGCFSFLEMSERVDDISKPNMPSVDTRQYIWCTSIQNVSSVSGLISTPFECRAMFNYMGAY
jgi:hypothetical protein